MRRIIKHGDIPNIETPWENYETKSVEKFIKSGLLKSRSGYIFRTYETDYDSAKLLGFPNAYELDKWKNRKVGIEPLYKIEIPSGIGSIYYFGDYNFSISDSSVYYEKYITFDASCNGIGIQGCVNNMHCAIKYKRSADSSYLDGYDVVMSYSETYHTHTAHINFYPHDLLEPESTVIDVKVIMYNPDYGVSVEQDFDFTVKFSGYVTIENTNLYPIRNLSDLKFHITGNFDKTLRIRYSKIDGYTDYNIGTTQYINTYYTLPEGSIPYDADTTGTITAELISNNQLLCRDKKDLHFMLPTSEFGFMVTWLNEDYSIKNHENSHLIDFVLYGYTSDITIKLQYADGYVTYGTTVMDDCTPNIVHQGYCTPNADDQAWVGARIRWYSSKHHYDAPKRLVIEP